MIVFLMFYIIPFFWTFFLAMQRGSILGSKTFIGLNNFLKVINDPFFIKTLGNTFKYVILIVPSVIIISLFLAVIINSLTTNKAKSFFRGVVFIPMLSSVVVLAILWKYLLMPGPTGFINSVISYFGFSSVNWLGKPFTALLSIAILEIWRGMGFYVITFMAGLNGIPNELYEAARIEGAGVIKSFFYITLPLLKPVFLFCLVMASIWNFQLFDSVMVMTRGGPLNSTATMVWYVYRNAFNYSKIGFASSMSLVLFVIILVVSLVQIKYLRTDIEY